MPAITLAWPEAGYFGYDRVLAAHDLGYRGLPFNWVTMPDQFTLAALRGANIDVQSDCEEGLCGSCEVRVLEGEVDHRDVVLTRAEREANNKMMACCSRSCGGKRVVLEL